MGCAERSVIMNNPPRQLEDWTSCPPGKLLQFAGREFARRRRQFLLKAGGACGAIIAAVGTGWFAFRRSDADAPEGLIHAGIACSRVRELGPKYVLGQLDESLTQRIQNHVAECLDCRAMIEAMKPKLSSHTSTSRRRASSALETPRRDLAES